MAPTVRPPPPLNIPDSKSVVSVHVIDTTSRIKGIPCSLFMEPSYKGLEYMDCPAFSFLIEHQSSGRKLLFDLGVRKDLENGPATIVKRINDGGWSVKAEKGVAEILKDGGVALKDVEAIIWRLAIWRVLPRVGAFDS